MKTAVELMQKFEPAGGEQGFEAGEQVVPDGQKTIRNSLFTIDTGKLRSVNRRPLGGGQEFTGE